MLVDAVGCDPPDIPECARPAAVGIKEIKRAGFVGGDLESKPVDVFAIDRARADRERDVIQRGRG